MAEKRAENEVSERNRMVALFLNITLGWMGGHRFYAGQNATGVAMLLTMGGFGVYWLYDFLMILTGNYRDKEGQTITAWA